MISPETAVHLRKIRIWLGVFMVGLVLRGVTAFPLRSETALLNRIFHVAPVAPGSGEPALHTWLRRVHTAIEATDEQYPFMAYGTDWLAFAHIVIAIAFIGPWVDPVRNKWVLVFGMIACVGVIPLALIAGADSRNSLLLAADRLQLWRGGRGAAADLFAACAGDGAGGLTRCLQYRERHERS